jgi:hypothetical protein
MQSSLKASEAGSVGCFFMAYVWYLKKCINSSYITFYAPQKPNDFLATSALNASDVANSYEAKHHIKVKWFS